MGRENRFNQSIERTLNRYLEHEWIDPHTAELILQYHSQRIRREYGRPSVTIHDIDMDTNHFGE